MSSSYSANQYDGAFKPHRLQNWCETKHFKERPTAHLGHTTFIADNRGHLLPGVGKRGSAWPDYKGTWNLPAHIPAQRINPTARSVEGLNRLKSWGMYPKHTDMSQPHRGSKSTNRMQTSGKALQDGVTPSAAAEAQTASQNHPETGSETTTNQSQAGSQAAEQATEDRLLTQCAAAEEQPALTPAAGEGIHSRPDTGEGRPTSNVSAKAASRAPPPSSKQRQGDIQQDQ
ncbi:protein Flattop [Archocentrus centrarchus]|uniref:protein Flattop n=1 Tax=Archocentrus centrarchus TaxID=63155 RepID=UPI0011EA2E59|nr:protein Flattop [Archocentrus centrarchus]